MARYRAGRQREAHRVGSRGAPTNTWGVLAIKFTIKLILLISRGNGPFSKWHRENQLLVRGKSPEPWPSAKAAKLNTTFTHRR